MACGRVRARRPRGAPNQLGLLRARPLRVHRAGTSWMLRTVILASERSNATRASVRPPSSRHGMTCASLWKAASGSCWIESNNVPVSRPADTAAELGRRLPHGRPGASEWTSRHAGRRRRVPAFPVVERRACGCPGSMRFRELRDVNGRGEIPLAAVDFKERCLARPRQGAPRGPQSAGWLNWAESRPIQRGSTHCGRRSRTKSGQGNVVAA